MLRDDDCSFLARMKPRYQICLLWPRRKGMWMHELCRPRVSKDSFAISGLPTTAVQLHAVLLTHKKDETKELKSCGHRRFDTLSWHLFIDVLFLFLYERLCLKFKLRPPMTAGLILRNIWIGRWRGNPRDPYRCLR